MQQAFGEIPFVIPFVGSFSAASYWGCLSSGLSFVQDYLQACRVFFCSKALGEFPFVGSFFFSNLFGENPICNPICGVFSEAIWTFRLRRVVVCCTYLPTCLPACLPACLPTYLPLSGGILKKIHVFSSTAYNSGGPSICKHSAHMVDFKRNSHAAKQACTSGAVGGAQPPCLQPLLLAW